MMPGNGSWDTWGSHVLLELKRLNKNVEGLNLVMSQERIRIRKLEFRSGIWGALGGVAVVLPTLWLAWLKLM